MSAEIQREEGNGTRRGISRLPCTATRGGRDRAARGNCLAMEYRGMERKSNPPANDLLRAEAKGGEPLTKLNGVIDGYEEKLPGFV